MYSDSWKYVVKFSYFLKINTINTLQNEKQHKKFNFSSCRFAVFFQAKSQDAPNRKDEKGQKQGHWVKLDDKKKKIYEGDFIDDIPAGKFTYFMIRVNLGVFGCFQIKGTVTRTKMFDAAGNITAEGKYINQKKDSIWKYYNHEGKLISDEEYVME